MNFWEEQRKARNKTKVYLFFFVLITFGVAFLLEYFLHSAGAGVYKEQVPWLGLGFLFLTFGTAGFQYLMYSTGGGSYVAKSVGAHQVHPQTTDPRERQLLNIVQECAIASGMPVPPVFIMENHQINAFAAGLTPEKAAVAVTRGALEKLNREELQGVMAHEFGHIYNGDMKISLRLSAMIMGFFFVLYAGLRMLQFSGLAQTRQRGVNPVPIIALLLMVAGAFTWLAGSILRSMVSRQREYLADACSVQFTRNPKGIASALRKIGQDQVSDMPKQGMAISHMYFSHRSWFGSIFATHPPLKKRIEAIEGKTYMPEEWKQQMSKV